MSRLIDKLIKIRQVEAQPMGFMLGRKSSENPRMQLVASLTSDNIDKFSKSLSSVDAVLVEVNKADDLGTLEKICSSKDTAPGGGWLKASSSGTLKKALNVACDFVVFSAATQVNALPKEKVGRILELDSSWSEGLLRTLNDLPLDAAFASGKNGDIAITLNRLMFLQRLIYMINKPVLVAVPGNLSETELQSLWDIGVAGLVVEVNDEESASGLAVLHGAMPKLASPAFRKKNRASPILPRVSPEAPKPEEDEEEEPE